jgi:hypothetical protein
VDLFINLKILVTRQLRPVNNVKKPMVDYIGPWLHAKYSQNFEILVDGTDKPLFFHEHTIAREDKILYIISIGVDVIKQFMLYS